MELFEYIMFNFGLQSTRSVEILEELYETLKDSLEEEVRQNFLRAIYLGKGYTEYRVKDIAEETGFTKTKVKFLVKQLIEDNQIELFTIENITFIKPVF